MSAFDQLYEGGASAEAALRAALRNVEELARYDARFAESAQQLASARATSPISPPRLRDYAEGIDAVPERLAEIEDRLALLDRLKRKYGKTVAEVIAFGEDVARKLSEVEDRDEILKTLRAAANQASDAYRKAASALTAERQAAAERKLAKLAEAQINSLAMKVRFQVAVTANDQESAWTHAGWDTVEYRIATNPGEPLKPLIEIASGGELSRVLLALKVAVEESSSKTRKKTTPRTLVFDEIDIGIGGRAAEAVGQKLKALGRGAAGSLRHPPAADRRLRRSASRRRKARGGRPHPDPHPRPRRPRPHPRSRPHVKRRQSHRHQPAARLANDRRQPVSANGRQPRSG